MKLSNLITEKDNTTVCPLRSAWIVAFLGYMAASFYNLHDFFAHLNDWADGIQKLFFSGMTVVAKSFTEKGTQDV